MRFCNVLGSFAFTACAALGSGGIAFGACDTSVVVEIDISGMAFNPAQIEICEGQTVRWTNNEPTQPRRIAHTVTADPTLARRPENVLLPAGAAPFHSGLIAPGASFEQTFTVAGKYKYICQPHEMMGHLGSITVVRAD